MPRQETSLDPESRHLLGHSSPTSADALAATLVAAYAVTILVAYVCDLLGRSLTPLVVTPLAAAASGLIGWRFFTRARSSPRELLGYLATVGLPLGWLLWRAAPSFLPLGSQGDLTHHLQLVDYIERHWHLPRGADVDRYLAEMVHYTPGVHILAALAGRWLRSDGLHVIYAVVSVAVALKFGFVYLIALRLSRPYGPCVRLGLAASALALAPHAYVLDSFMRDGFLAQALSETFVLGMWWALSVWDDAPARWPLALCGLLASAAFLTWPIYVGPPFVALAGLLACDRRTALSTRLAHGAWATAPLMVLAALYIPGRIALLGMSDTPGAVLRPSPASLGRVVIVLALAGIVVGGRLRHARSTIWFLLGIAAQSFALFAQALATGNSDAYMAFKTLYLLPYPLAAMALLAIMHGGPHVPLRSRPSPRALSWIFLVIGLATTGVSLVTRRPDVHAVTEPMWRAGAWARDHVPRACIAYMVPDDDTAYWLHLAVLRNPRASGRTADDSTYDLVRTTLRWYEPNGLPYAIVDLAAVSTSVHGDFVELARFGNAAVVRRRSLSTCADEHLPPAP